MASSKKPSASRKASATPQTSPTSVTRIKASDTVRPRRRPALRLPRPIMNATNAASRILTMPRWIRSIGSYFAGSWHELRQVHWPDRRATWSMTGALLVFTAFFTVVTLLLDASFKLLFQRLLG